ncbi:MAG: DUF2516 family protein [Bifidobacteriaceae bacterium]|jgi:hypothetical protein|nr:DUF2516 family protein [Bifidobacteriaceae bacterium]
MGSLIATPVLLILGLANLAALAVEVAAFVIALKAPPGAYTAAGKMTKGAWVGITVIAMIIGLGAAPLPGISSSGRFGGIASIAAVVAALVFMVDVRPAIKPYRGPSGGGPRGGGPRGGGPSGRGPRGGGPTAPGGW